jgi:glycosyltransferase involved in cell wall biosynthesis
MSQARKEGGTSPRRSRRRVDRPPGLKLLVVDTAYPLADIRQRKQEKQIVCRDLGGFFEHVWTVHPFASIQMPSADRARYGPPESHEFAPGHTFIEGKIGRFRWLKWLPPLNFLISQLGLFVMLWRLMRTEAISAIRAPGPLYTGLFSLALARVLKVPLVIRVGANHEELRRFTDKPMEPRIWRTRYVEEVIERFVLAHADLVAGANQNNLDFALAHGARAERSTLFRYGNLIDPVHFVDPAARSSSRARLNELGVRERQFIITIGRLEDNASMKHPEDIVQILKVLKSEGKAVKAVIVGKGPMRTHVENMAKSLGVADLLVMAGSRPQDWLAEILPSAAVHLCPQAGRALSEAALAAVPTVAYDIDWQRELIEPGKTGILVDYRDWRAMAEATKQLLENPAMAAELGTNLRSRALAMLDPEELDEHERREYRKLLTRRAGHKQ